MDDRGGDIPDIPGTSSSAPHRGGRKAALPLRPPGSRARLRHRPPSAPFGQADGPAQNVAPGPQEQTLPHEMGAPGPTWCLPDELAAFQPGATPGESACLDAFENEQHVLIAGARLSQ